MRQFFRIDKQHCRKGADHERFWEELMRGVVVGTGKRLDEVGQRLSTMLTRLFTPRDLRESKARLEAAQPVAHVGYSAWNLDTDRATWSDETYWIFGLKPQEGPIDLATLREMIHPEGRQSVLRTAEEAVLAEFDSTLNIGLFAPVGRCAPCTVGAKMRLRRPPQ